VNFEEQHIVLNNLKINYVEAGAGQPVLFLHNGSGFWQSWKYQLQYFSAKYRVFAIDWPGCGESEYPGAPLDLNIIYNILKSFIEHKQLEGFYIIGNCIGASVALHYSIQHPNKIRKLMLFNICPGDLLIPPFLNRKWISTLQTKPSFHRRADRILHILFADVVTRHMFPKILFGKGIKNDDVLFQKYREKQKEVNQKKSRVDQFFSAHTFNLLPIIKEKKIPDHALTWGVQNGVAGLKKHGYWHYHQLQSQSFHLIENAGHLCMYEAPDTVNQIIEDYLSAE